MRAKDFIKEEEKLDEILPLIGLAARGAGALAGGAARLAGRAALKGAGALARGVGSAVSGVAGAAAGAFGSDDEEDAEQGPNAKVGTQMQPKPSAGTVRPGQQQRPQTAAKQTSPSIDFRPGAKVNLPTTTGRVGNFKVTKVTGNDIEIENPDKYKLSGEPDRMTFTRDELAKLMGGQR